MGIVSHLRHMVANRLAGMVPKMRCDACATHLKIPFLSKIDGFADKSPLIIRYLRNKEACDASVTGFFQSLRLVKAY